MVTRVYDRRGNVVHDCAELRCAVSWDGYERATGKPVRGRAEPDAQAWRIVGNVARAR